MTWTSKSSGSGRTYRGQEHFQHWYRDNQVYFLTARCRDRYPAFASDEAKTVFWQQFDRYTDQFGFTPWVTSLIDNHYHTVGYLRIGKNLGPMMKGIHGLIAKLVNDILQRAFKAGRLKSPRLTDQGRLAPFWHDRKGRNYFDGCLRDEKQGRLTYAYVLKQSERHGVCDDYRDYPHTRVNVALEPAIRRSLQLGAFLEGVVDKRYRKHKRGGEI